MTTGDCEYYERLYLGGRVFEQGSVRTYMPSPTTTTRRAVGKWTLSLYSIARSTGLNDVSPKHRPADNVTSTLAYNPNTAHEEMIRAWLGRPVVRHVKDNPVARPVWLFRYRGGYRIGCGAKPELVCR